MKTMSIPEKECQYYDYPMAVALYKELGCKGKPRLCVLIYQQEDQEYKTIGWCSEESDDTVLDFPIFKNFQMKEEAENIEFIPLNEQEVFMIDGQLYIVVALNEGLGIRRVNLLFNESIVRAVHALQDIPDIEYKLCKVYTNGYPKKFLDYCWVGRLDTDDTLIISPIFCSDETNSEEISGSLEAVPLKEGETLYRNGTLWQVSSNESYGICLIPLIDLPFYINLPFYSDFNDEKTLLN